MFSSIFKIRKISDLTQICIIPVMILSIFLTFYLYVDMGKIEKKSQELVNNAIPHVMSTQQGVINLVHLKRNIEIMTTSIDLQTARKAYVNTHILVSESVFSKSDYLQHQGSDILYAVNRLWKLRLQLDELRATVGSSLSYMDTLMYLIYNEQPLLFPELDSHVNNYTDLYTHRSEIRDVKGQHEFYYRLMMERLGDGFDREAFLKEQRKKHINVIRSSNNSVQNTHSVRSTDDSKPYVMVNDKNAAHGRSGNTDLIIHGDPDAKEFRRIAQEHNAVELSDIAQQVEEWAPKAKETPAVRRNPVFSSSYAFNTAVSEDQALNAVRSAAAASLRSHRNFMDMHDSGRIAGAGGLYDGSNGNDDGSENVDVYAGSRREAHGSPIFFASGPDSLRYLAMYRSEMDRFETLWALFTRLQAMFAADTESISSQIDSLAHTFTTGETSLLHAELSDISILASQIKPMVMMTVGFCIVAFWIVILLINRYIIMPLRNVVKILIVFRRTRKVDLKNYANFFALNHVMEIREIMDMLPKLFSDFSDIEQRSSQIDTEYKKLLKSSKFDGLTKVLNRGTLNRLINEIGLNTPANFAVLMVDIDHFKNLNDTMGHQKGDEVLFAVAHTLQKNLSKRDMVFRYGGEEFCIILTGITPANAYKVAARLCYVISELKLNNDGVPDGIVTISVGISLVTVGEGQFRVDELIAQADKALYLAKRNGRNCAVACPKAMVFGMDQAEDDSTELHESYHSAAEAEEAGPTASDELHQFTESKNDKAVSEILEDNASDVESEEAAGSVAEVTAREIFQIKDEKSELIKKLKAETTEQAIHFTENEDSAEIFVPAAREKKPESTDIVISAEKTPAEKEDHRPILQLSPEQYPALTDLFLDDDNDAPKMDEANRVHLKQSAAQGDNVILDHNLLALSASDPDGGFVEDPLSGEDAVLSVIQGNKAFVPGLIDADIFFDLNRSGRHEGFGFRYDDDEDELFDASSPFMMKTDLNEKQRISEDLRRNNLYNIFRKVVSSEADDEAKAKQLLEDKNSISIRNHDAERIRQNSLESLFYRLFSSNTEEMKNISDSDRAKDKDKK